MTRGLGGYSSHGAIAQFGSANRWLDGEDAAIGRIDDPSRFATHLADFLNTLRSIDTNEAPSRGLDNFFRGGELSVYDAETRECINELKMLSMQNSKNEFSILAKAHNKGSEISTAIVMGDSTAWR